MRNFIALGCTFFAGKFKRKLAALQNAVRCEARFSGNWFAFDPARAALTGFKPVKAEDVRRSFQYDDE
ncbi:hypothetical protein [Sagittula stellata]|uniref:hypothetical protein n=1 Tax=Sagittula stellata TaxID=52603 RepID=UPI0012F48D04|nr:hypothetical protein [Sagittula stellata]